MIYFLKLTLPPLHLYLYIINNLMLKVFSYLLERAGNNRFVKNSKYIKNILFYLVWMGLLLKKENMTEKII